MGQRHQIYIILPYMFEQVKDCCKSEPKMVKSNIVAIHHQWLYGITAGKQLLQFLKYVEKSLEDEYSIFTENGKHAGDPQEAIASLYSINIEDGYYHRVHIEDNNLAKDPNLGDNNDGITIIDLRDKENIKYCMMFIGAGGYYGVKHFKPLSYKEYGEQYYGDVVISGVNSNGYWKEHMESFKERQAEMYMYAMYLEKYKVMTKKEVIDVFPTLLKEETLNLL